MERFVSQEGSVSPPAVQESCTQGTCTWDRHSQELPRRAAPEEWPHWGHDETPGRDPRTRLQDGQPGLRETLGGARGVAMS